MEEKKTKNEKLVISGFNVDQSEKKRKQKDRPILGSCQRAVKTM